MPLLAAPWGAAKQALWELQRWQHTVLLSSFSLPPFVCTFLVHTRFSKIQITLCVKLREKKSEVILKLRSATGLSKALLLPPAWVPGWVQAPCPCCLPCPVPCLLFQYKAMKTFILRDGGQKHFESAMGVAGQSLEKKCYEWKSQ